MAKESVEAAAREQHWKSGNAAGKCGEIYVEFPQSLRKEKEGFKVLPALLIPESGESGEASNDIPEPLRSWSRGEEEPLREG
jgi:hypothetical protein